VVFFFLLVGVLYFFFFFGRLGLHEVQQRGGKKE